MTTKAGTLPPASEQGDATYSDAAFYHVTVTADDEQVVVGSGVALSETSADGQQTIELAIGPARDFYLAISPRYEVVSRTVGETTINSYAPAEFMAGAEDAAAFATDALRLFNERFEPYPYTELDIVATSTLALGIEYPGIIAITLHEYDPDDPVNPNVPNQIYMETTTAHEVAHQWFYNMVGNDQLDEPWLDEAVTQYATYLYYLDMYGEQAANEYKGSWNGRFSRVDNEPIPIGLPVSAYQGAEYSAIIYGRGSCSWKRSPGRWSKPLLTPSSRITSANTNGASSAPKPSANWRKRTVSAIWKICLKNGYISDQIAILDIANL
ncbi:MAG: M1 family aminopeptidase [Acidimicrobiia bacterium]|nr:M1 family aminopeptidase [Acidimicrobiia bacterium]